MNLQAKPTEANFKLRTVKSISRDNLQIKAFKTIADGNSSYEIPEPSEYPLTPHPDFFAALDKLKPYVVSHFALKAPLTLVESKDFHANGAQKKIMEAFVNEIIGDVRLTGVSIDADWNGVIVTSVISGESRNTKKLQFHNKEFGADVQEICDLIKEETYKFLYEGKAAQLEVEYPEGVEMGELV